MAARLSGALRRRRVGLGPYDLGSGWWLLPLAGLGLLWAYLLWTRRGPGEPATPPTSCRYVAGDTVPDRVNGRGLWEFDQQGAGFRDADREPGAAATGSVQRIAPDRARKIRCTWRGLGMVPPWADSTATRVRVAG